MLSHIRSEWRGVDIALLDPDICLQVDSSLSYGGCSEPSAKLRQFVYLYQQSCDFDHETIVALSRIATHTTDDSPLWDDIVALELQRDCGLPRHRYLTALGASATQLAAEARLCYELLSA